MALAKQTGPGKLEKVCERHEVTMGAERLIRGYQGPAEMVVGMGRKRWDVEPRRLGWVEPGRLWLLCSGRMRRRVCELYKVIRAVSDGPSLALRGTIRFMFFTTFYDVAP